MGDVFKSLIKGTNLKAGSSSKLLLLKDSEKPARFDEDFKVVDTCGTPYSSYVPLQSFSELCGPEDPSAPKPDPKASRPRRPRPRSFPSNYSRLMQNEFLEADFSSRARMLSEDLEERLDIKATSPIQKHAIPILLSNRDLVAVAPTGSGKTLAYLIPILLRLKEDDTVMRVLILVPTDELIQQVKSECIYLTGGNLNILVLDTITRSFECSIAIATPLTVVKLLKKFPTYLDQLEFLVMDETDKLLEEGYYTSVDHLMELMKDKPNMQRACFSSVVQSNMLEIANAYFNDPLHITIGSENFCCSNVDQRLICVTSDKGKYLTLKQLLMDGQLMPPILIFLQSANRVDKLYEEMAERGYKVERFTKDLTTSDRQKVMERFREGTTWILICTDILCRGINFKGVHSVVNYDLPLTSQVYINRVGRAGRGLNRGNCFTFYTLGDVRFMNHIVQIMKLSNSPLPEYLRNGPTDMSFAELKRFERNAHTRMSILPMKKRSTERSKSNKRLDLPVQIYDGSAKI